MIVSRAPARISFAGGGTDISPYPEEKGGCVVSATIDKYYSCFLKKSQHVYDTVTLTQEPYTYVSVTAIKNKLNTKAFPGDIISTHSNIPPRSGIGGSSAKLVSLIGALNCSHSLRLKKRVIAELAYEIGRDVLQAKGGRQDEYATAYGGLNFIDFRGGNDVLVAPLQVNKSLLRDLEQSLLLVYLGDRMDSNIIQAAHIHSLLKRKKDVLEALDATKNLALIMRSSLIDNDLSRFGEFLDRGWQLKKKFNPLTTNYKINRLYKMAKRYGAVGGKVTGAGGGGHMLLYCEPRMRTTLKYKLMQVGVTPVDFKFDKSGLKVCEQ